MKCPDCGGDLDSDSSSDDYAGSTERWFYCTSDGCEFDCDSEWSDKANDYVPVLPQSPQLPTEQGGS